jgi:DNA-binding response OmpR family regulator
VFAENPNRPLQRDWLLEVTAHREMEAFDRAIDLRITRLRRKIEADPAHPDTIRTVRGVGFRAVNRLVLNLEQLSFQRLKFHLKGGRFEEV